MVTAFLVAVVSVVEVVVEVAVEVMAEVVAEVVVEVVVEVIAEVSFAVVNTEAIEAAVAELVLPGVVVSETVDTRVVVTVVTGQGRPGTALVCPAVLVVVATGRVKIVTGVTCPVVEAIGWILMLPGLAATV